MNRRTALSRCLLAGAGGLAALAGCSTDDPPGGDSGGDTSPAPGDTTSTATVTDGPASTDGSDDGRGSTPTATDGSGPTDEGLDLQEANVTGVAAEPTAGRTVRFEVTLYHDDDGEDGYANWWQVETRDGERLGRRELLHAHGTREFTRSEEIEVPEAVDCVVVRGHDQTHEYGGQAALVGLSAGTVRFVKQGSERSGFADEDCA